MRTSIFENIVTNEPIFTELVCNMFRIDVFRKEFYKFLSINDEDYQWDTQYKTANFQQNGRPDLYIENDDTLIFCEFKICNRRLTDNQPIGYLDELAQASQINKKLYFIIPKKYNYENVWDKLVLEFNQSNISTQTLYWEDFYMQLEKSNKAETLFCEFFNLLKNWFGIEPVQFSGKELDDMERKDMGNFIAKVNQVIDNVYSIMHKEDYKLRRNNQETSYGFDISREGKELGWFGVWYRIWAEQGDVLILKTNTDMSLDNKELKTTRNKTEYFSLDDFLQSDETDTNIAKYLLQKFNEMK